MAFKDLLFHSEKQWQDVCPEVSRERGIELETGPDRGPEDGRQRRGRRGQWAKDVPMPSPHK